MAGPPTGYCKTCGFTHWGDGKCPHVVVIDDVLAREILSALSAESLKWIGAEEPKDDPS
jgi:hypothetical protein